MPFTFFAHQAPIMGLASRGSTRVDGLALVVGTMAPDLVEVTAGWTVGSDVSVQVDGHALLAQPLLAVFSVLLTVVTRRIVLPVAPLVLPSPLRGLRDGLLWSAAARPAIWTTYWCALLGAATHLLLDSLTSKDGFVVEQFAFMRRQWIDVAGRQLATYTLLQVALTVVLGAWAAYALWRWAGSPRPARDEVGLTPAGRVAVLGGALVGAVVGVPLAIGRYGFIERGGELIKISVTPVTMTWCWVAFAGLAIGCLLARSQVRRATDRGGDAVEGGTEHRVA